MLAIRLRLVRLDKSTGSRASASELPRPSTTKRGISGRRSLSSTAIRAKTVAPFSDCGLMNVTYFGSGSSATTCSSRIGSGMTVPSNPILLA